MKPTLISFLLVVAMWGACAAERPVSVHVISADAGAIGLEVRNSTAEDIVVLSPEMPMRLVDDEKCSLILSTKVTDLLRPYAFTPALETVRAGFVRRFRVVVLDPPAPSCKEWTIDVEYAYVTPAAVTTFEGRDEEEFRQYENAP